MQSRLLPEWHGGGANDQLSRAALPLRHVAHVRHTAKWSVEVVELKNRVGCRRPLGILGQGGRA